MEAMLFTYPILKSIMANLFRIQGVPVNNFAPMRNCPGVQGNLNCMPGGIHIANPL